MPAENEPNVKEDLQGQMLEGMQIHFVHTVDEALEIALSKPVPAGGGSEKGRVASGRTRTRGSSGGATDSLIEHKRDEKARLSKSSRAFL